MKNTILSLITIVGIQGCKPPAGTKVDASAQNSSLKTEVKSNDFEESESEFDLDEPVVESNCTYAKREKSKQCDKLKITFNIKESLTGDSISDSLTSKARVQLKLIATVEGSNKYAKDGLRETDRALVGFRNIPEKAKASSEGGEGVLSWLPKSEGMGSIDVVFRDVIRCQVETAYSKKGVLDDDKADECRDMENDQFSSFEEVETIAYTIEKSSLQEQKEAALKQVDIACKTNTLTSLVGSLPYLASGSAQGILGAGTGVLTGSLQCQAAKEAVEAEFSAKENQPQFQPD